MKNDPELAVALGIGLVCLGAFFQFAQWSNGVIFEPWALVYAAVGVVLLTWGRALSNRHTRSRRK